MRPLLPPFPVPAFFFSLYLFLCLYAGLFFIIDPLPFLRGKLRHGSLLGDDSHIYHARIVIFNLRGNGGPGLRMPPAYPRTALPHPDRRPAGAFFSLSASLIILRITAAAARLEDLSAPLQIAPYGFAARQPNRPGELRARAARRRAPVIMLPIIRHYARLLLQGITGKRCPATSRPSVNTEKYGKRVILK